MHFGTDKSRVVIRAAVKLDKLLIYFRKETLNESAMEALGIRVQKSIAQRLANAGMRRLGDSRKQHRTYGRQN